MKANDDIDHHLRPVGAASDWRRSRSESSGAVDDLETSYVPAAACLPGPHRRHYVNIFNHFFFVFLHPRHSVLYLHAVGALDSLRLSSILNNAQVLDRMISASTKHCEVVTAGRRGDLSPSRQRLVVISIHVEEEQIHRH